MRWSSAVAFSLALLISDSRSALAQIRFDSWTIEDGLPQNSILDILQTRDGYLWLATEGGLARFDGLRFTVFDRSTPGIGGQRIAALHEDRQGTLWAVSREGLLVRYRNGRFTTYSSDNDDAAGAVRIDEDENGILWVTAFGRLGKFDGERLAYFDPEVLADRVGLPAHLRYWPFERWWRHDSDGLHVLVAGRVQVHPLSRAWLGADVKGVSADRQGTLWVRTAGAGVVKFAQGRAQRFTTRDGMPGNDLEGVFHEDAKGGIWFWDEAGRLYRIIKGSHELTGLVGARAFYVDREGSTWIGTLTSGLQRFRESKVTVYSRQNGLSYDATYSVLRDSKGSVWIGTWDAGLNRFADGRITTFGVTEGLPSPRISCVYEDSTGRLWVGTQEGLTYLQGGRFTVYQEGRQFLSGNVWSIHQDRTGTLWFATDDGLIQLKNDGSFVRYSTADGLSHNRVTTLFEDRSGALWIGAYQGVTQLRNGVFRRFGEKDGFFGNDVRSFYQDREGVLWIGTYDGGLYRLTNERLTRFTRKEGLHDNGVFQILEDDAGYFWMGSNRGIARVSRHELNEYAEGRRRSVISVAFGSRDGLPNVEVNGGRYPAGWKMSDGRLWFPTMGGVVVIDPSVMVVDVPPPRALVEEVRVSGETVDFADEVVVPSGATGFEIRYTAPTFIKPEQVRFRYRLAGLDEAWVENDDRRSVNFYRVAPGNYTFTVTASNHAGVWDPQGARLQIRVLPPYWATWWFRLALISMAAMGLGAVHVYRVRRLEEHQKLRSAYLQELIDSQERERRRISNEMHDSIGHDLAIVKRRAQEGAAISSTDSAVRQELDEIHTVANRIDREMKAIALGLRPYYLDKIGLTKSLEALVREIGDVCSLELSADIANLDGVFEQDSEIHIYRIVQEALSNVVKHAQARRASVTVTTSQRHVDIRVDDDGLGAPGQSSWAFGDTAGFGLVGMRERAQLLGGHVSIGRSAWGGTSLAVRVKIDEASDHATLH